MRWKQDGKRVRRCSRCPPAPSGLSPSKPEVPWHSETPARICPGIPFAGTPRPTPSGSPVELVHKLLHSAQVAVPDLLHYGDVVSRQDLRGQAQSCLPLARSCSWGHPWVPGLGSEGSQAGNRGSAGTREPGRELLCWCPPDVEGPWGDTVPSNTRLSATHHPCSSLLTDCTE